MQARRAARTARGPPAREAARLRAEGHAAGSSLTAARPWRAAPAAGLLACAVLVPCVFVTRVDAVFVAPKLAALWAELALALAVAAAALLGGGAHDGAVFRLHPADVAVALLVVLTAAAWAASGDPRQSLYGERLQYQGLLTLLLYAGLARRRPPLRRRRPGPPTPGGGACRRRRAGGCVRAGPARRPRPGVGRDPPEGRVFSSIGQPNALAAYLVMVIPVAASLLRRCPGPRCGRRCARRWPRWFWP